MCVCVCVCRNIDVRTAVRLARCNNTVTRDSWSPFTMNLTKSVNNIILYYDVCTHLLGAGIYCAGCTHSHDDPTSDISGTAGGNPLKFHGERV